MDEINQLVRKVLLIPVATFIEKHGLPPLKSTQEESDFIKKIVEDSNCFEIYSDPYDTHKFAVESLILKEQFSSAAVLIGLTIEEDINFLLRVACLLKGHSHKDVDEVIKNLNHRLKIEFVLPLLGVELTEQYKTAIFEFQKLRNRIVHNKAIPAKWNLDDCSVDGSAMENRKISEKLVKRYSFDELVRYSEESHNSLENIDSVKMGFEFLMGHFDKVDPDQLFQSQP